MRRFQPLLIYSMRTAGYRLWIEESESEAGYWLGRRSRSAWRRSAIVQRCCGWDCSLTSVSSDSQFNVSIGWLSTELSHANESTRLAFAACDQRYHDCGLLTGRGNAHEQPRLPADRDWFRRSFERVVVDTQLAIFEVAGYGGPLIQQR